jgi:hypothetical protein
MNTDEEQQKRQVKALDQCIAELKGMRRHVRRTLAWDQGNLAQLLLTCRLVLAEIYRPSLVFPNWLPS